MASLKPRVNPYMKISPSDAAFLFLAENFQTDRAACERRVRQFVRGVHGRTASPRARRIARERSLKMMLFLCNMWGDCRRSRFYFNELRGFRFHPDITYVHYGDTYRAHKENGEHARAREILCELRDLLKRPAYRKVKVSGWIQRDLDELALSDRSSPTLRRSARPTRRWRSDRPARFGPIKARHFASYLKAQFLIAERGERAPEECRRAVRAWSRAALADTKSENGRTLIRRLTLELMFCLAKMRKDIRGVTLYWNKLQQYRQTAASKVDHLWMLFKLYKGRGDMKRALPYLVELSALVRRPKFRALPIAKMVGWELREAARMNPHR